LPQKEEGQESHRRIRICCSNKPRWPGITLSDHPHAIHRLGKASFEGLACTSVLEQIFRGNDDAVCVKFTEEGLQIRGEGMATITARGAATKKTKRTHDIPEGSFLAPYDRRTTASFQGFSLKFESA